MLFFLKFRFPWEVLWILVPLALTGILNVVLENDTYQNFFKIFLSITVNLVFYRYAVEYYKFDVGKIFRLYMQGCFIVACLGVVQLVSYWVGFAPGYNWQIFLPLNKWGFHLGGLGVRINSTFSEPAYFGTTLGPAFFIAFYQLLFRDQRFLSRNKCIVIIVTYVLSFSSLAYIGIFAAIVLMAINFGLVRYVFIAVPVSVILFFTAYNNADEFRVRIDGIKALFIDNILEKSGRSENKSVQLSNVKDILKKVHGSSFVLYNNYHIAVENFKHNPLFGSGLGSHEFAFDKYNLSYIIGGIYEEFNNSDANSMFLRLLSETGLMGIVFTFLFIYKFYVAKSLFGEEEEEYWLISNALLVVILIQLLRQGNYTFGGFMLFCWMYYYNSINYKEYRKQLFIYKG